MRLLKFAGLALLVLGGIATVFQSGNAGMVLAGIGVLVLLARHVMLNDPDVPRLDLAKVGFRAGQVAGSARKAADEAIAASGLRDDGPASPSVAAAFRAGYKDGTEQDAPTSPLNDSNLKTELAYRPMPASSSAATAPHLTAPSKTSHRAILIDVALYAIAALLLVTIGNGLPAPHWAFVVAHFLEITLVPALLICLLAKRWSHIAIAWPLFGFASVLFLMTLAAGRPLATGSVFIASGLQLAVAFLIVRSIRWCLNRA
jgi:hypothetical protein